MDSHTETTGERPRSRHFRIGPFFKALLTSILIEILVLAVTGSAMGASLMRHSGGAPRPVWEDFLAQLGFILHLPSILIAIPLGLFLAVPLIQIGLMTCVLRLIFRARANRRKVAPPFLI